MAEVAILDLPGNDEKSVANALQTLDTLSRTPDEVARLCGDVSCAASEAALRFPQQMRREWEMLCQAGWRGQAAQVHAQRGVFLQQVEHRLELIRHLQRVLIALRDALISSGRFPPR